MRDGSFDCIQKIPHEQDYLGDAVFLAYIISWRIKSGMHKTKQLLFQHGNLAPAPEQTGIPAHDTAPAVCYPAMHRRVFLHQPLQAPETHTFLRLIRGNEQKMTAPAHSVKAYGKPHMLFSGMRHAEFAGTPVAFFPVIKQHHAKMTALLRI